jgi:hypothetical protein
MRTAIDSPGGIAGTGPVTEALGERGGGPVGIVDGEVLHLFVAVDSQREDLKACELSGRQLHCLACNGVRGSGRPNGERDLAPHLLRPQRFFGESIAIAIEAIGWREFRPVFIDASDIKAVERFTGTVPDKTGVTDTGMLVLCDRPPDTAEIVTVEVAGGANLAAVSVSTLVPVVSAGEKAAVTPSGRPLAVRWTSASKLPRGIIRILLLTDLPCETDAAGAAEMVKSGAPALGEGSTS